MKDIDKKIHEHNLTLKENLHKKEKVIFDLTSRITGKTIKVTLEGDAVTCKDCRDKILHGFNWTQGTLWREKK